jgi:hypothetical protein
LLSSNRVDNGKLAAALRSFGSLPLLLPKGDVLWDTGVDGVDFLAKFSEEDDDEAETSHAADAASAAACNRPRNFTAENGVGAYAHALASDRWLHRGQAKALLRDARSTHGNNTLAMAMAIFHGIAPARKQLIDSELALCFCVSLSEK